MAHYKLALLGFGNVGKALARLLLAKREELLDDYQLTFSITGIATGRHGSAVDPNGLDIETALLSENLANISVQPKITNVEEFLQTCQADVLFENTPVDYQSGEPAISHLRLGLEHNMHVITANKGPVVHAYEMLSDLAKKQGKKFYFESTVMDGAPIFSLFRGSLPAAKLLSFRGVLNSTTNMILTRMENGEDFAQAVAYCQKIGIAETDPSGDVDGWDAAIKVSALVNVLMGVKIKPSDVDRKGIGNITRDQINSALQQGKRWKLICQAEIDGDMVRASVSPEIVGADSPMYAVEGTTSIVEFKTDVLGLLSVVEKDPGPHTTAYGLFADFINAVI